LTPEPIVRPAATPTLGRPERLNGYRTTYVQDTQFRDAPVRQRIVIYSETRSGRVRGTAVKRWIWRTHSYSSRGCRYAGRRITPPARYTVARGDSLWRISEKHYNRGSKYRRIYRANRSLINVPDLIYPCQRFKITRRR
jgi:nucleoid-associated protein YgaU